MAASRSSNPAITQDERALAILGLLITQQQPPGPKPKVDSWVHRRSDRVELLDSDLIGYRASIEFELPQEVWGIATNTLEVIPLTTINRGTKLRSLELVDEEGRVMPVATPEESDALMGTALHAYARLLFDHATRNPSPAGTTLAQGVADDLRAIAKVDDLRATAIQRAAREAAMKRFEDAATAQGGAPPDVAELQRRVIMTSRDDDDRDISLALVLRELERNYMIAAVVPGDWERRRRTLTLSWIETLPQETTFRRWLSRRMAWSELKLSLRAPAASRARNYQIEMSAPSEDIAIEWGGLAAAGRYKDCDEQSPAQLRFTMRSIPAPQAGDAPPPVPLAAFILRPTRMTFLSAALFTCGLCAALLGVGLWRLTDIIREVESASTLLLFVPGLLSLYFVRQGEHPIASQFFSGVRVVVIAAAISALAAGVLVIVHPDPGLRRFIWTSLLAVAILALLAVLFGNLRVVGERPGIDDPVGTIEPVPESRSRDRRRASWAIPACCAGLVVLSLCAAVGLMTTGGIDNLGLQRRFEAEIDVALRNRGREHRRFPLGSFAGVPWTRMYLFGPNTAKDKIVSVIGERRVAAGEEAGRKVRRRVEGDESLIVLVDRSEVAEVLRWRQDRGTITNARYGQQCFLRPTDVLHVTQPPGSAPVLSVLTTDRRCDR